MIDTVEIFAPAVEKYPEVPDRTVAMGADMAQGCMIHLLKNEKIERKKKAFGPGILRELHRRLLFYYPKWAGQLRADNDTRIAGRKPVLCEELEDKVYLFERWLQEEVDKLRQDPENLTGALYVAAAASYGIVGELHPFDDGNGRVSRMIMNGILMLNTKEGLSYNIYTIPVPLLRDPQNELQLAEQLAGGRRPKVSPYLQALRAVDQTWELNPLEIFIASKWIQSIDIFLINIKDKFSQSNKNDWKRNLSQTERQIVDKIEERRQRLQRFIDDNRKGNYSIDKVPDFFALKYLSLRHG